MEEEEDLRVDIKDCYWMLFLTKGKGNSLIVFYLYAVS